MPHAIPPSPSRWLTRLLALGFGVLLVFLIEGGLRLAGFGGDDLGEDPFVGFSAVEPLFGLNHTTNMIVLRPERSLYFASNEFSSQKNADTFRIFAFGGSTVQGRPYSIETAFPEWLRINLKLAHPDKQFEVINCGGISYASYRLVPIMEECLSYEPDLFVLCTGQNEFLEARTYGRIKTMAKSLGGPTKAIRQLASYQALDGMYRSISKAGANRGAYLKPTLKMEVDAFLDYRRGLSVYHRDPDWREGVIAHFKENIRRMHSLSKKAQVPLMILNPPFNLKDCPPFKSESNPDLSSDQRRIHQEILAQYHDIVRLQPFQAADYLVKAKDALDSADAAAQYLLGQCYLLLGDNQHAKACFERALNEDICPLRILPEMRSFLERYAHRNSIPYLDLQALLLEQSESPIVGNEMLVDHIHPSIHGHQLIGEAITVLVTTRWLGNPAVSIPESTRKEAYKAQLESLEELYYTHGQTRLQNLMAWTKGMTEGPPIEMHVPIDSK